MYIKNKIIHFLAFGSIYMNIEVISRVLGKALVGFDSIKAMSLMGYTSLWMFLVGGICGVMIGSLNDSAEFYKMRMWQQMLTGGTIITIMELSSGIFLNLYLGLHIWDYSKLRFNFLGQICLKNCIYWYLLSVVIIWFDDALSHYFYGDEKPSSLGSYFIKLITLQ